MATLYFVSLFTKIRDHGLKSDIDREEKTHFTDKGMKGKSTRKPTKSFTKGISPKLNNRKT